VAVPRISRQMPQTDCGAGFQAQALGTAIRDSEPEPVAAYLTVQGSVPVLGYVAPPPVHPKFRMLPSISGAVPSISPHCWPFASAIAQGCPAPEGAIAPRELWARGWVRLMMVAPDHGVSMQASRVTPDCPGGAKHGS
jgi:hypothetical protein